jgi:hypothetical protein
MEKNSNLEAAVFVIRTNGLKFIAGYDDRSEALTAAAQFTLEEINRRPEHDPEHQVLTPAEYFTLRPAMRPPPPEMPVLPPEPVKPNMADYSGGSDDAERDFLARCYAMEMEGYRKQMRNYEDARPLFEETMRVYRERKAHYDSIFGVKP